MRVSLTGEDVRLVINSRDTVAQVFILLKENVTKDFFRQRKSSTSRRVLVSLEPSVGTLEESC